jgi:glycosyltransferase involved in cell wall biosynthesis
MRKAHTILTVSETSRRDIEHYYPFARGKVVVIPNAPGPVSWIKPDYDSAKLWSIESSFILAVGTVQPRKNLVRLIQAYILLQTTGSVRARLLIVGRHAWQSQIIREAVKQSPDPDDIVFLGYVDDPTLAALYHTCDVFAFPSLYEGFGLPVVEAMACGAPVITSNTSSLPEVAGEAAVLVDPHSTEEIAEALAKVLNSSSMREELCERGRHRAAQFSWENSARRILGVMLNAAEDND